MLSPASDKRPTLLATLAARRRNALTTHKHRASRYAVDYFSLQQRSNNQDTPTTQSITVSTSSCSPRTTNVGLPATVVRPRPTPRPVPSHPTLFASHRSRRAPVTLRRPPQQLVSFRHTTRFLHLFRLTLFRRINPRFTILLLNALCSPVSRGIPTAPPRRALFPSSKDYANFVVCPDLLSFGQRSTQHLVVLFFPKSRVIPPIAASQAIMHD
ncbi:hypothetical protein TRVL_03367 [Trypanosoma vivax]|nr:hypothetical protein TRVL_03367 [Trypanosoma vivax]